MASAVNLERALTPATPLGGHLVSGHVDGVGYLRARRDEARSLRLEFEAPAELARYIARKGSICIDGVSLTVNDVEGARFGVNIVPHTLAQTTLAALQADDPVNLEVDLIARYLERLLTQRTT
jgi:riboflavin synthase